ncbi:GNAT family N-acetyltransferase [Streptomyces sp. NPDC001941]|uniref:GNAT family N-acetyltransferase n=1 Tax=Streptomyces sp. NPDC001941 TaxID=3154659 RepID=UPI0033280001
MTTPPQVLRPADWDEWYGSLTLAFGGVPEAPEEVELYRELTECERSLGVRDDDRWVGTAGAFSFGLTVPGGQLVRAAGVTMVSVAATHRRRGVLTSMMRRQLDDVHALGEPLAVLTASEPDIYGRFGYGLGSRKLWLRVDTRRVTLRLPGGTDRVRLREVDPAKALAACEEVYARLVPERPGTTTHAPGWERQALLDPPQDRDGGSALRCVVAERDGVAVGYARFHTQPKWAPAGPDGVVLVRDLDALDPAARGALWNFLFGIDLTSWVVAKRRPVDDPLLQMVSDVRRCEVMVRDELFVRVVDVGAALAARSYQVPLDVVLEVADDFCPWNAGRWRLVADGPGARCERTEDPADLALGARELGAAYLGGTSLVELAGAGRVRELVPGTLERASLAFGAARAPWVAHGF